MDEIKSVVDPDLGVDEDEEDDEEGDETIRAKWSIDRARSLTEAAEMSREFAKHLDGLQAEGWRLRGPIEDDWGFIYKPDDKT